MALKNSIILTIVLVLTTSVTYGKSKLPVLATKQSIRNLRFISLDGKFTYYQKKSGHLVRSTNYNVRNVLSGEKGTNYLMTAGDSRKKIIISKDQNYHNFIGIRHLHELFIIDFGGDTPKKIGEGISPRLHLNDTWISFYNPHRSTIYFKNIKNQTSRFKIKLFNTLNPYFIPKTLMLDKNTIIFTDINSKGIPGLIKFDRKTSKMEIITKSKSVNEKIEICALNGSIIIARFGILDKKTETLIEKTSVKNLMKNKNEIIYKSPRNDLGNIKCSSKDKLVYFIKNLPNKTGKDMFEIAALDIKDKSLEIVSDVKYASQIINMDGRILLPYCDRYYVIYGNHDLSTDYDFSSENTETK